MWELSRPFPPTSKKLFRTHVHSCPFWSGKKEGETHLLVLIPATVGEVSYTLDLLGELIKHPKRGQATAYRIYREGAKEQIGNTPVPKSYWVLMTRDMLPGSRKKNIAEQEALLTRKAKSVGVMRGGMSTVLESATCVLMEHVRTGVRLYGDNPGTYTRCQEVVKGNKMCIGGFSAAGLLIDHQFLDDPFESCHYDDSYEDFYEERYANSGVACSWKF